MARRFQPDAVAHLRHGAGQPEQLDAYLDHAEEAEKRDHRKIGRELDLFHLQAEAPGSVFWHPKGFIIYDQLEAYMRRRLDSAGYLEVKTPQLMDAKFWERPATGASTAKTCSSCRTRFPRPMKTDRSFPASRS